MRLTSERAMPRISNPRASSDSAGAVLVHTSAASFQAPGGGEVQLLRTVAHLKRGGCDARLFSPWEDRIARARAIHLFGMSREGLELARVANEFDVPVVLSPIAWFDPSALIALAATRLRGACRAARWELKRLVPRWPSWRGELLDRSRAILPNSLAEADQLMRLFGVDHRRIHVVPNGVDARFLGADATLFRRIVGGDFILYTGRIEPRKNVLGLIRSLRGRGVQLVMIGDPVPGHAEYAERCRVEGHGAVHWFSRMEHDDPLLASAYAAARVFAMPSWFETPGLSALEAAMAGAAVVITPIGSAREYFGEMAHYARPDRPAEIQRAVQAAWRAGPHPELAARIARNYSWSEVARRTSEVYELVA